MGLYSGSLYVGGRIFRRNFAPVGSVTFDAESISLGQVLAVFQENLC